MESFDIVLINYWYKHFWCAHFFDPEYLLLFACCGEPMREEFFKNWCATIYTWYLKATSHYKYIWLQVERIPIKNPKAKHLPQRRRYRRLHKKYGTGTLINKDKNPAQRIVPNPQKRGRRKQIGNPRYNNDKNPSTFDRKLNVHIFF